MILGSAGTRKPAAHSTGSCEQSWHAFWQHHPMSCYPGWCGLASDLRSLDTRIESLSGEIEELAKQDATPGGLAFLAALDSVPELDSFDRVFK
jgi:hypothetical protein